MTGLEASLLAFVATITQAVVVLGIVGVAVVLGYLLLRGALGKP